MSEILPENIPESTQENNVDTIIIRPVEEEITQSYIDYAMSVIISRALPDVRDWLKPVIRRILYTMFEMRLAPGWKHKKSMWVVWQTLRDYHPHGDSSVYQAMVRLAQPFSMRYPMVDGQWNFWSIDGDGAAAARYTEAKLTKLAMEMLEDIAMDTVDRRDNYDQSRQEPTVLPTKFPYTLCNWTMGIAVGMATNMPPNNLGEVIDACLMLIDNREAWVDEIMEHIKWPDFPTGWIIFDSFAIKEVYAKWKWWVIMRGKVDFEMTDKWHDLIVISEIPYQVNKSMLVAKIWQLVQDKKLEWIVDITDASNRDAMRITMKLKKWVGKEEMLIRLYKYTDLQCNFNVNNVALVDGGKQPRHCTIKDLLLEFVDFRRTVVTRRSQFQLNKAKDRLHILEWLQKAIDILDAVIELIKNSQTREEAKQWLINTFEFSEAQAEYVLMLRLQTLVWLEIQKILNEIGDKTQLIEYLEWLLADSKKLDAVVIDELIYIKDTYADERRTQVSNDTSVYELNQNIKALKKLDELIKEPVITRIWNDYKIKVLYQTRILKIPLETITLTNTNNQEKVIAISDSGELVIQRLKDLGKFSTNSPAMDVVKEYGLKWSLVFTETMWFEFDFLVILTNQNTIKKVTKQMLFKLKKFPTVIMSLEQDERIIKVVAVKEWDSLGVISEWWKILIFDHSNVRAMWKTANWVKAISLEDWDNVSDLFVYRQEPFIFIHDGANWKLVSYEDLADQKSRWVMKRGQSGVICHSTKKWQRLRGAIAIEEWGVSLVLKSGRIDVVDSSSMDLKLPNDPMTKLTNWEIIKMYRPWAEKEERRNDSE